MTEKLQGRFQLGEWLVDPALDTISRDKEVHKLEPRMMRLLTCLAEADGAVVSQERLLAQVWSGVVVGPASVYQAISQLRRLLGDTDPEPSYIATVPRKGYRLVAPIRPVAAAAAIPGGARVARPADAAPPGAIEGPSPAAATRISQRLWIAIATPALLAGLAWLVWQPLQRWLPKPERNPSIVVLPFVDMSSEHADQPFCDGLTEELSNWLAQLPTLRVVARTSAFKFRGLNEDVRDIGKALDATHVLEGSMRRAGDHMRVVVQLIDARNGYHLWSSEYDRPFEDAIRIQEDIARSVADNLAIRLTLETAQRFAQRRSASPEAYRLYLLARHYQQDRTRESNAQAMELYRQALAADPQFALAHVGLAYASINQHYFNKFSVSAITEAAEPLLEQAAQLDPELSELYAVRAALREEQDRVDDALHDLKHAIVLNPNDSWAFAELARLYLLLGQPRDALQNEMQALALDPLDFALHARQCLALQDLARFEQASAACERARSLQGQGDWAFVVSYWLAWSQGDAIDGLRWTEAALKVAPYDIDVYERRADFLLTLGRPSESRQVEEQARAATHDDDAVNVFLARIAYYEQGAAGLRAQLATSKLAESEHSRTLMWCAYLQLLLGDAVAARDLVARAMRAPDFDHDKFSSPWYARWGASEELTLAAAELMSGDVAAGQRHLRELGEMLDRVHDAGEERWGVYSLQAKVLALSGKPDEAIKALRRAAELGWPYGWWAEREPYFASLRSRSDFRALVARVEAANQRMGATLKAR